MQSYLPYGSVFCPAVHHRSILISVLDMLGDKSTFRDLFTFDIRTPQIVWRQRVPIKANTYGCLISLLSNLLVGGLSEQSFSLPLELSVPLDNNTPW